MQVPLEFARGVTYFSAFSHATAAAAPLRLPSDPDLHLQSILAAARAAASLSGPRSVSRSLRPARTVPVPRALLAGPDGLPGLLLSPDATAARAHARAPQVLALQLSIHQRHTRKELPVRQGGHLP